VDGHICTSAALGALTFSITPAKMVEVLTTGKYGLKVPQVVNIEIDEDLEYIQNEKPMFTGKDIALFILGKVGSKDIKDNGIIFTGSLWEKVTESQKMTVSNMMGESNVGTVYFSPSDENNNETYHKKIKLSAKDIKEFIALPGSPEFVKPLDEVVGQPITQVFIGGCTNGRLDDMKDVAEIVQGKKVHRNVTMIVCPASRDIANHMDKLGYSASIRNSGGIIINPGCGACSGAHQGVLGDTDTIITTTARNTTGRMGSKDAKIYLASPKVAALSALEGRVTQTN